MSHPQNEQLWNAFKDWLEERNATVEDIDRRMKVIYVKGTLTRYYDGGYYEKVPDHFLDLL